MPAEEIWQIISKIKKIKCIHHNTANKIAYKREAFMSVSIFTKFKIINAMKQIKGIENVEF